MVILFVNYIGFLVVLYIILFFFNVEFFNLFLVYLGKLVLVVEIKVFLFCCLFVGCGVVGNLVIIGVELVCVEI